TSKLLFGSDRCIRDPVIPFRLGKLKYTGRETILKMAKINRFSGISKFSFSRSIQPNDFKPSPNSRGSQ
ncbi:hypothetical protein, partial [Brevundimonas sp. EAKA]|uniref:hypothetical protein n=1 Tax=Brevundimonas sp. EAKA TaxID=1495854 RepID=UPI001E42C074